MYINILLENITKVSFKLFIGYMKMPKSIQQLAAYMGLGRSVVQVSHTAPVNISFYSTDMLATSCVSSLLNPSLRWSPRAEAKSDLHMDLLPILCHIAKPS